MAQLLEQARAINRFLAAAGDPTVEESQSRALCALLINAVLTTSIRADIMEVVNEGVWSAASKARIVVAINNAPSAAAWRHGGERLQQTCFDFFAYVTHAFWQSLAACKDLDGKLMTVARACVDMRLFFPSEKSVRSIVPYALYVDLGLSGCRGKSVAWLLAKVHFFKDAHKQYLKPNMQIAINTNAFQTNNIWRNDSVRMPFK